MITSNAAHFLLYSIIIFIVVSPSDLAQGIGGLNENDSKIHEVELIYCKGQSIFPVLLTAGQIDGYVGWQPELVPAEVSGIGKIVSYSQDFPPNGQWHNSAQVLADDMGRPGRVKELTKVGLGRPRDRMNPSFLEMKETVLANLNGGDQ